MFGSKDLLFSSEKYGVAKSLRFRSGSTTYLDRTPSLGNRTTWTWSGWVKRGALGVDSALLATSDSTSAGYNQNNFRFLSTDNIRFVQTDNTGATTLLIDTSAVFRDPSSFYHIVLAVDTTSATNTITGTSTDRVRLYVNGVQISAFSATTVPAINLNTFINNSQPQYIGRRGSISPTNYFDGYLAEVNFIDGQALTPSSFGFYDNNGIWQPQGYTGTYGTNGFYLKFTDVGATSGSNTGYGKDFSGFNTNYFTTNNFNSTSTSTSYDSMYDSPVNASNGITGIGNYAVFDAVIPHRNYPADGNLKWTGSASNPGSAPLGLGCPVNFPMRSGKWYWEITVLGGSSQLIGIADTLAAYTGNQSEYGGDGTVNTYYYVSNGGSWFSTTYNASFGSSYTTNDVISVAYDADNQKLYLAKNNTWQASMNPSAGTGGQSVVNQSGSWVPNVASSSYTSNSYALNAGQRPFAYTPPSGFSALNTQNLTTPTITNGAQYMAAVTYTGTGSSQTITASSTNSGNNPNGTTFQPDFVWVKGRSGATDHALYDAVRGVQKQIESNTTGAETTETTGLTAFTSSGFTTGALAQMNTNTATYVAWEWNAGGSNATNTTGTIQSTVRANTSAGFSVVTYTGTGANATVGHGLGVIPSMMIVKRRNSTGDWPVYHSSLGNTNVVWLDLTNASTATALAWNNTSPTSSVYTVGTGTDLNASGGTYVSYCFAPVAGYSAFGSYTANASTDGPMVFTNFRPRFVLLKNTTRAADWIIYDSSRDLYNTETQQLYPNLSSAEASGANIDFLSNGFKIRAGSGSGINNTSGDVYIYAAFAENPFKISRAR